MSPSTTERLRATGLRVTVPRLRVLEVMLAHPGKWMSVEDIAKAMVAQDQESAASIVGAAYRATNDLGAAGLLYREWQAGLNAGKAVYLLDPFPTTAQRDHLVSIICRECGNGVLVNTPAPHEHLREIAAHSGMAMAERPVSIQGTCKDCRARE